MVMFTFLVFDEKNFFWPNLVQIFRIFSLISNLVHMKNSMVMFTFLVLDWNCPFWANLVKKIKIISLNWNLVPLQILVWRIQWWFLLSFFQRKYPFRLKLVQKSKIVSLSWNLVPTLIRMCKTQSLCFCLFEVKFGT